jgi:hypothetical protein
MRAHSPDNIIISPYTRPVLEPRLVGRTAPPERLLYLAHVSDLESWPLTLAEPIGPFVGFIALDTSGLPDDRLRAFAVDLLAKGCVYMCAWGPDANRIEVVFDLVAGEAEAAGRPYVDDVLMTTSDEEESLDDALWFAVFTACPPKGEARAVLAVCDSAWSDEIESRLADSQEWNAKVLEAEEERGA